MKLFFHNKKGISELISVVLLVAFAVAMAALVMNWNTGLIKDTSDNARIESDLKINCNLNLGLGIDEVNGERQICFDNVTNRTKIVLENTRNTKIEDVQIRVSTNVSVYGPYALDSVYSVDGKLPIEPGQAVIAYLNFTHPAGTADHINGTVEKITLFPGILVQDQVRLCVESSIDVEGPINNCG